MKYELEDKDRQAKLESLYTENDQKDGGRSFSQALQETAIHIRPQVDPLQMFRICFGRLIHIPGLRAMPSRVEYEYQVLIAKCEIKLEYNKNDWNDFACTKPPEDVPMRAEIWRYNDIGGFDIHCCRAIYAKDKWFEAPTTHKIGDEITGFYRVMFKPWREW